MNHGQPDRSVATPRGEQGSSPTPANRGKASDLWQETLSALAGQIDAQERDLWLEPLRPRGLRGDTLVISCPNHLHRSTVSERYAARLEQALQGLLPGGRLRLETAEPARPAQPAPGPRQLELPRIAGHAPRLNRRFVFDNFLAGGGNEFACAAAKALAGGSGLFSNSLFLMSPTGLGKSHLTQAVGHQVMGLRPEARVAYLTAEEFTNQMTAAIRGKKTQQFKERFRCCCDLLLLEEVQFLAGKEKTQEELVYTLDALADQGKRIVFTGRMGPSQVKGLSPALASRLADSVAVGIEPPNFATRVRILERQASQEGIPVPREVLEFLASEIPGDVRRMRSALVGLMARASLAGRPLDLNLAAEVLGGISARLARHTPEKIRDLVASVYGLEPEVLTGKSRKKTVVRPRNMAMFLSRRHTDASYKTIGQVFNRDHATVMYGVDQIERQMGQEPKLAAEVSFLEQRLGVSS